MKRLWRLIAFDHPKEEKSIVYRQNLTDEQLLIQIKKAMDKGANLMSIRGFKIVETMYELRG